MPVYTAGKAKEIMTLHDVANYLQLNERSILKMARAGEIPATKVMNQWRFMRSLINEWLMYKMEKLPPHLDEHGPVSIEEQPMSELLVPDFMNLEVVGGSKSKILGQLTFPMVDCGFLKRRKYFLNKLLDRELLMTTAIGHGVAVPHPRHPIPNLFPNPMLALGICREGTDYEAPGGKPVYLFFTICASEDTQHLHTLAKVSRFASNRKAVNRLKKATTVDEVTAVFDEFPTK
jgi:nitrogen PTS system EIIA component